MDMSRAHPPPVTPLERVASATPYHIPPQPNPPSPTWKSSQIVCRSDVKSTCNHRPPTFQRRTWLCPPRASDSPHPSFRILKSSPPSDENEPEHASSR
ncbi:hypothetical protein OF83DRAFT_896200 [Amylostereum chailletii]|nr:hypothetical protein OF83DRAFT_896200 [Amylostereum chailletii]